MDIATRIWARDTTVFAPADAPAAVHEVVRNRLGWLDVPTGMTAHLPALEELSDGAKRDGINQVYVLGMGGSSLCAEVLRLVGQSGPAAASLTVLDTTDEQTILDVTSRLDPARALFIVASKSGTTIEPASLEQHFRTCLGKTMPNPGSRFVAITDPGTALETHARENGYRATFTNPPDIGGRYSALSLFGLVPAALLDQDVAALLASARQMADACHIEGDGNPGVALGTFMATSAKAGRDKLTLLAPAAMAPLGLWIEQLVAESTGKIGRGILPVVDEPIAKPEEYGSDRAFVALLTKDDPAPGLAADLLAAAGHPVFRITSDRASLGGEFLRWEFATAVAGAGIGVNPFDEPNVADAKHRTSAQLDVYRKTGALRIDPAFTTVGDAQSRGDRDTFCDALSEAGLYFALLDYLPPNADRLASLSATREWVRKTHKLATTHGTGPRYLHSTGQCHKGGPNTGLFVILTSDDVTATMVPGADYSFSVLKHAQALGDFEALTAAGRRVVQLHAKDPRAVIDALKELVASTTETKDPHEG